MAVEMHSTATAKFSLPEKFQKLKFLVSNESSETMSSNQSTPSSPLMTEPYYIHIITDSDHDKVLNHLRNFFFRDEPMNTSIKLLDNPDGTCKALEKFSMKNIGDGQSLMAVSESGDIVGVCINNVIDRNAPEESAEECPDAKFQKIVDLLGMVDEEADVFGKFPDVDTIMNVKILSVDGRWRGRGIAKQLMDRTREIARKNGNKLMRVDCSSHFSARAIARLGFECIYTKPYAKHKVDGVQVFNPPHPHTEVAVYVQRINPDSPTSPKCNK